MARPPSRVARAVLLVASGFALALLLVAAAAFVAVRALTRSNDAPVAAAPADVGHESAAADPIEAEVRAPLSGDARLTMHNVALLAAPGVTVDVVHMEGALRSTKGPDGKANKDGIDLEKPDSFDVVVDDAEVRVREDILQKLAWSVDEAVPGLAGARVALDRVLVRKGHVTQEGTFALGPVKLPFTLTGTLAATPDGGVRVEVTQAHVGALDTLPIVEALNIDLRTLLSRKAAKGKPVPGVRGGEGLTLVLTPAAMQTKPRMVGKVTSVRIEDDVVVVRLGSASSSNASAEATRAKAAPPEKKKKKGPNSLVIAGGYLVLGKMTMNGAIAELVDTDEDPLQVDMKHFQRQLFASVCRATPQGVRIHMIDANDVGKNAPRADRAVGK